MKLYYFNPNDHGLQFFVLSDSEENAIKALNEYLIKRFEENPTFFSNTKNKPLRWGDPYFQGKEVNGAVWRKGYTIDVYEHNQVIESEIA
jgi:hypothetical protein